MVEVSNNFIQECEANVGTYKFGKIKVNYIDDNPFNYEQGAYSSSNGAKIDAEQSIRYNKLVECEPNFKYKIELGNSAIKMKIITYTEAQAFIAAHDNLVDGNELTTEATAKYISVTIYSNDTLEGTAITLNNTIKNGEIAGVELQGNTTQNGTPTPTTPKEVNNVTGLQVVRVCGKNLLDYSAFEKGRINSSTGKIEHADKVTKFSTTENTISFTATKAWNNGVASGFIPFKIGTYIIKGTVTGVKSFVYVDYYNADKSWLSRYSNTTMPFNPGATTSYVLNLNNSNASYIRIHFEASTAGDVTITNLQLEKGSTATTFEKYQGKDYEINLGKNLANPSDFKFYTQANASCSYDYDTNTLTMTTLRATISNNLLFCSKIEDSLLKNGKSYTISSTNVSGVVNSLNLQLRNKDGTNASKTKGTTITYDNNYSLFIVSGPFASSGSTVVPQGTIAVIKDIQVEEGSSASDFTPYYEPIELNKIGNYQDFIRKGTGKNLLEPIMASATLNGVTCTNNGDGSFTLNGTATAQTTFRIDQSTYNAHDNLKNYNGTYTFSCDQLQADMDLILVQNNTWSIGLRMNGSNTPVTANVNKDDCFIYVQVRNGKSVNNLTIRPMLEKSSSATSFEPYACRGKNLYEGSQDFSGTWINESSWSTADETYNGLVVKYRKDAWNGIMKEIDVEKNGVYTFSFFAKKETSGRVTAYLTGSEVNATPQYKDFNLTTEWQRFSITFVATTGGKLKARVENSNNDSNTYICGYQLEKNNTMTSYEPYVYSTLKDKWYIEKNVLKLVVPNAVPVNMQNNSKRVYVNGINLGSNNILRNTSFSQTYGLYCDILEEKKSRETWNGTQGISYDYNTGKNLSCIDFAISGLTTIAEYQNALKGKVIYAIANTPEYTLIENEELIEQLNALSHAETQEGTTNITSSGILPAILEVTPNLIESIRGKQTIPIVGYNITGDDDLINFKITSKADSNGNILGATSQSQVDIEIFNENNTHNLENKQVYISTGLNEIEGNYCKWQPFTITQTKDTQTKNHTTYTGYDDMMRGNEAYIDNVDYGEEGVTLYDFTCKLAKEMGMALGNITMTNGDFIVKGNNFTNNEAKLVVLKNVAQMAGGFAMIDRDNLLRIVELSPEDAMTPIELTTNLYTEDFQNSAKFGEINEFAIGETNIETNAIVRSDDASIAKNGVKKIEILDNMFLGLLEDKEIAIEPLWDAFNGFSYYPFKTPYNGYPYIDLGDKINITDINSNVYSTLVLNNVFEYNGGYKGNIGAEALSITAAKYKTNNTLSKQFRKVGIDIDRVEGKITSEIDAATDGITKAYNTAISQTEKNIKLSVTEINNTISGNPKIEGDTGLAGLVQTIKSSYLTVDSDGFKAVSSTATAAQEKADKVEENTKKIVSQLHFDAETGLTISAEGSTDDDMKLNLTNSQVNFMYRNSPVLIINGNKIEFTGATFQKFDLGNYVWQAEDDDSLSLIYEGD